MRTSLSVVETGNASSSMKEMVEMIARMLVDQPDAVSVSEINGVHSLIVELTVAKADLGKVIGKKGRTAGAIRILVSAASAKIKKHIVLEIME
jgi:uncharacterized protein